MKAEPFLKVVCIPIGSIPGFIGTLDKAPNEYCYMHAVLPSLIATVSLNPNFKKITFIAYCSMVGSLLIIPLTALYYL